MSNKGADGHVREPRALKRIDQTAERKETSRLEESQFSRSAVNSEHFFSSCFIARGAINSHVQSDLVALGTHCDPRGFLVTRKKNALLILADFFANGSSNRSC